MNNVLIKKKKKTISSIQWLHAPIYLRKKLKFN